MTNHKKAPKGLDVQVVLLLFGIKEAPVIRALLALLKAHFEADGAEDKQHRNCDEHDDFLSLPLHAAPGRKGRQPLLSLVNLLESTV